LRLPKFESYQPGILNSPAVVVLGFHERNTSRNRCRSRTFATSQLQRDPSLMRRFGQIFLEYRRILIPMDSAVRVRSPVCLTDVQKRRRWFERTRRTVALLPSASSGNQAPETALAAAVLGFQPGSIGCVRLEGTEILDCGCEALALYEMPRRQRVGLAAFEDRMDDIGRQVGKPQNPADMGVVELELPSRSLSASSSRSRVPISWR
jgi:hypothetical protein